MPKGSIGTQTNIIIKLKKPEKIKCDCSKCRHSKRGAGTIYCTYYDIFSPNRTQCARYYGPTIKKDSKIKRNNKKKKNIKK